MNNALLVGVVLSVVLVAAVFVMSDGSNKTGDDQDGWSRKAMLETPEKMAGLSSAPVHIPEWPPVLGHKFPNVELFDHTGKKFSLDSLPDQPTLIEFTAMSCAGCQAFAGGNELGGFQGFASQPNLRSVEEYFKQYTGHDLHAADINNVQIIIYDLQLKSPSAIDLAKWRKHFRLDRHPNTFVVSGGDALVSGVSYSMIPGFLLLDDEHVIQYHSTGHHPKHNFYTELLPGAKKMLDQRRW